MSSNDSGKLNACRYVPTVSSEKLKSQKKQWSASNGDRRKHFFIVLTCFNIPRNSHEESLISCQITVKLNQATFITFVV